MVGTVTQQEGSSKVSHGNFQLIDATKINGKIPVEKYRSTASGLNVVIAQVEGPLVDGFFCLATEAHDDDGLPHTLEHLIFLGSEEYPYKGVLDLLANRCLSSGTNAWTDTDHTCYTMKTAGSDGFLSLMPIYLDHVLFPTLTDSGFVTEVYHVDGDGKDGGVVYSEMQGVENVAEEITYRRMLRTIYPEPKCGYRQETGGMLKNLRESTDNEKVRAYHRQFYRPENLTLIIAGQVEAKDAFDAIKPIEEKIQAKKSSIWQDEFQRPWQSPIEPLTENTVVESLYPNDVEDSGIVYIGWRGPKVVEDLEAMFGCMVLMEYLTETSVSVLQASFVEIDDPYASRVSYSFIENSESTIYLTFQNVPLEKLQSVETLLYKIFNQLLDGTIAWDKERMATVINRRIQEQMSQIETAPQDAVAYMVIGDVLYGHKSQDFHARLNSAAEFRSMLDKPDEYWLGLLKQYLCDRPRVVSIGKPSKQAQKDLKKEEEDRVNKRKEELGQEGLEKKKNDLEAAMEKNDIEPPKEMLQSVPIPGTDSIKFLPMTTYTSDGDKPLPSMDLNQMPVYCQFDQIGANFVYLSAVMNTGPLPVKLKPYLPLFLELLVESPVFDGDKLIPYEEVVALLAKDLYCSHAGLGISGRRFSPGRFSQAAILFLQPEPANYAKAIDWLRKLLFCTKFTPERIKVLATKMENSVSDHKRSGPKVTSVLLNSIVFSNESNLHAVHMIRQQRFLKEVVRKLEDPQACNSVVADLEDVRFHLTDTANLSIFLAADMDLIKEHGDPLEPWHKFLPPHIPKQIVRPKLTPDHRLTLWTSAVNAAAEDRKTTFDGPGFICGNGSCESNFMAGMVPSLNDMHAPDLPALHLFTQYLTQCEGPMWRQIRGQGLAYGYNLNPSPTKGVLAYGLYRATLPVKAYAEFKRIVMSYLDGEEEFEDTLLESAKSSLIFEVIEKEKTIGVAAMNSIQSAFEGIDREYNRDFIKRISNVTKEELKRVGNQYARSLFDYKKAKTVVVSNPAKVSEIQEGLKGHGLELRILESLEDSVA